MNLSPSPKTINIKSAYEMLTDSPYFSNQMAGLNKDFRSPYQSGKSGRLSPSVLSGVTCNLLVCSEDESDARIPLVAD
ncbi:hypothetical protein T265_07160 [Opisthorchis viverrini]|uniref:Uncharacterized protein n=1 Tax=Opisthorchis viverrini TaxID=6198 RepID=A0A074ZDV6_OPIVI|nr:hypothetical protein T265_07160 [Opisthorchis viverrini]KER25358.1 hypothetical protein T265_07160 [Opisthorchis viverrini]